MTVKKILEVQAMGDAKGSALKDLALYYGCDDFDLSPISDHMAELWQTRQKCQCWEQGSWVEGCDTCMGTKEKDPCTCGGDKTKCDYYEKEKRNDT